MNKNNTIFAKFMGWEGEFLGSDSSPYIHHDHIMSATPIPPKGRENWDVLFSDLKYDKSWDWLIPVLDKICSSDEYIEYLSHQNTTFWDGITVNTKYIDTTYKEILDYINWFNDRGSLNQNQILGQSTII